MGQHERYTNREPSRSSPDRSAATQLRQSGTTAAAAAPRSFEEQIRQAASDWVQLHFDVGFGLLGLVRGMAGGERAPATGSTVRTFTTATAAAPPPPPSASDRIHVFNQAAQRLDAEVTFQPAGNIMPHVHALHPADGSSAKITGVRISPSVDQRHLLMEVHVPPGHPRGTYVGAIVDATTGADAGTIKIRVP